MIATADEGGITNIDESATDNDFEFKSIVLGLNNNMKAPISSRLMVINQASSRMSQRKFDYLGQLQHLENSSQRLADGDKIS